MVQSLRVGPTVVWKAHGQEPEVAANLVPCQEAERGKAAPSFLSSLGHQQLELEAFPISISPM